jgi:hypothetical protein
MAGESDLGTLLRGLTPAVDPLEYGYGTLAPGAVLPGGVGAFALIREDEGLTVIAPATELAAAGIRHAPGWAHICLTIHSSLEAIGMTAAIARLLGDAGISANVVAAYYHDHIFVPWERRHEAAALLERAGNSAPGA